MQTQPTANDSQARMTRGLEILESKNIRENEDGSFAVPSQTGSNIYEVRLLGQTWACSCPDFEFRHIEACKHIFAVKMYVAASVYLKEEPKPKVFAEDAIPCDNCGSIRTMKYGKYGTKQMYFCKDCNRKFRESSLLKKAKFTPELITLTLDLYFSGLSLRKVSRNVSDHFSVDINYSTIYTWIKRYVPMISEYVNTLSPELSNTWHADELFVKMRGGVFIKKMRGLGVIWNVMDRQTRFLIASKLTETRDVHSALAAFEEAVRNAHGKTPERVYTDSLRAYIDGIGKNIPNAEHIRSCGVNLPHRNNNRIERMNGTLRERTKVQRGLKTVNTPIAEGMRIQYNFIKPHEALEGKTPAEASGIKTEGVNKWLSLMRSAEID